ncbi:hypothetical protein [Actinomadura logoneensis]|uniref:hypothetical protein n=1 Tax=Actinomadura logoneensis TaxID=2293572 RepID=UPI001313E8F4|nr:hypothetical protein [Actinomadura logoneensis]
MSETQWGLWATAVAVTIIAVAGGAAYARSQGEKARLRGLREWADVHGWTVTDGDIAPSWRDRVPFEDFRLDLLLRGELDGRPAAVGSGSCTVRKPPGPAAGTSGPATRAGGASAEGTSATATAAAPGRGEAATYRLTVLTVQGDPATPDMEVRERGLGAKLMESLAADATDEDAFEARFEIVPAEARGRLSDAAVQAHLDSEVPAWSVRGGEIMALLPGEPRAADLDGHLAVLRRLTEIVPAVDGTRAPEG